MNQVKNIFLLLIIFYACPVFSQEKVDLLILNKKYDAALTEIEKVLKDTPSGDLLYKKGLIYKLRQQYQKAAEAFFSASEMAPRNVEILGELAETLSLLDNYTDAAGVFKQALSVDPNNLTMAGKLGSIYINLKNYSSALDVFSSIYKKDSTNIYWNKQYAFCIAKMQAGDSLAIKLYEGIIARNPRDVNLYISLSTLYLRVKNQKNSLDVLKRGLAEFPGNQDIMLRLGNFHLAKKNYVEAAAMYKKYLAEAGPEYEVLRNYAICLYFNKSEKESIEVLDQCVLMALDDPIVLFYQSLCHKKLADYPLAEEFMKEAIEAAIPGYLPEMYHHLGQIYGQERKFEKSIDALDEAYRRDTTNFEILFEIATTFEEYNSNKTLALNYYRSYLIQGKEAAKNVDYALTRMKRIKEDLFLEK